MHIYFVRHGETALNSQNVHQSPSTPLSSRGKEQAVAVGELLRPMNPDIVISSEYTRTQETARIIGMHTGRATLINGLFNEIVRPSILLGQSHFGPRTLLFVLLSVLRRSDPRWHYKDGENYTDVSMRAKRALAYLEALSGSYDSVVVVSHTVFINILVAHMCDNRMPSLWKLLLIFLNIERMRNTDVIHAVYEPGTHRQVCAWQKISEGGHPQLRKEFAV